MTGSSGSVSVRCVPVTSTLSTNCLLRPTVVGVRKARAVTSCATVWAGATVARRSATPNKGHDPFLEITHDTV